LAGDGAANLRLVVFVTQVQDGFVRMVKTHFVEKLERIAVFGSRARGDSQAGSDIDVLAVLRLPMSQTTTADTIVRQLLDKAWELVPRHYVPISLVVLTHDRFAQTLAREGRFALDIEREGICL
jgi:predicted nucleotidyltransferase